jgi:hypothetical protein
MKRIARLAPSPAMVVSCIALLVALGGVGYAATALPRNSVGTPQLKRNAVTSIKVKDRSLLARDFRRGQLPRGLRGLQGAKGDKGDKGDQGEIGPSVTHQNIRTNNLALSLNCATPTELTTLTLNGPATYLINASGFIFASGVAPIQSNSAVNLYRGAVQLLHGEVGQELNATGHMPGAYAINRLVSIASATETIAVRACRQAGNATPTAFSNTLTATLVQSGTGAQTIASAVANGAE